MGRLQTYMFRQLLWWTVLVSATLTAIVWLTQSLRFVEMIVNRGLSITTFVMFTLLLLPTSLTLIGPIALFAATVLTYNKMNTDSELVVQSASGLSPARIARPAIILALLLTVFGYLNSLYLTPTSYRYFKDLQRSFRTEFSSVLLQEGIFNPVAEGITVFIRDRSPAGELFGLIIHDERSAGKPVTMMAERGAIVSSVNGPRIILENGNRQEVNESDGRLSLLYFDRYTFDMSGLQENQADLWREPRERYLDELIYPSSQSGDIYNYRKLRMEGFFRLASPPLYVAFVLIAVSFLLGGTFNRRGQMVRIFAAVGVVVALQVFVLAMKSLAEKTPQVELLIFVGPALVMANFLYLLYYPNRRMRTRVAQPAANEPA
jgi:lipopolysaccharide export system permease protein